MSNLLPEKSQQKIGNEYRARFVMSGSALVIVAAVFTALALSPSFGVLFVTRPAAIEQANQMQQGKQDSTDIAAAQALAVVLAPVAAASSSVSSAIVEALGQRPSGVHVDSIVYTTGTLALGGAADSRTNIDKYRTALQADPDFSSVKVPVGDLVGAQGGRFTITLTGNF